jgi:hypothetical protein
VDTTGYESNDLGSPGRTEGGATVSFLPYIRHTTSQPLSQVYGVGEERLPRDREKLCDELFLARICPPSLCPYLSRNLRNLRFGQPRALTVMHGWNREMRCVDEVVTELESDAWLVNQIAWMQPRRVLNCSANEMGWPYWSRTDVSRKRPMVPEQMNLL